MRNYNIGLDIGTSSVGWAVVDNQTNKVMKKAGNSLWGVRLFEEAHTAQERRMQRSTRRRYDRRKERINLLQDEFKEEINKVDNCFFQKLEESKYRKDDLLNKKILISPEERKLIRKYYNKYPTIYHLRQELMNTNEKMDIRLVYLAIHHIIKYRGNFIYEGKSFNVNNLNVVGKLKEIFISISENINELDISEECLNDIDYDQIANIINGTLKNDIKVNLVKELSKSSINKKFSTEFSKLVIGNKFNVANLFNLETDTEKNLSISLDGTDYDDKLDELEQLLGDYLEILEQMKELYDMVFLKKIFKGSDETSISSLMISRYNQHKEDLNLLKNTFKKDKQIYKKFFGDRETSKKSKENDSKKTGYICLYDSYVHNNLEAEDLCKEIKKYINNTDNTNFIITDENFIERLNNNEILPRITTKENGKYPYQLNKDELIKIIENQGRFYPFLLEKVKSSIDDDLANTYKLVRLLEFKIPYFVGPLVSDKKSKNAWMIRKIDNVKIDPYNFDEVIDKEKTAEKFILRMISHCTYLLDKNALPNNSILYSEFKVLNELKQIKINNERLTNEQQHKIINELFMKTNGSITETKFRDFLLNNLDYNFYENDLKISGYSADGKFANNMQSYVDFFGDDGIFAGTSYAKEAAEEIIKWITIFDDKDILEKKVRENYPELSDNQIKNILNKKYKGWGRLSKELLTELTINDKESNIPKSIMDLMYETDENFMQIINNDEYNFQKLIAKANNITKDSQELTYDVVANLATSPATKRGIYQALKVVREITDYMGYEPKNIILEMARSHEKKERKDDRKKHLQKLYEGIKEELKDNYKALKQELDNEEKIDTDKLYLYYLQEGKCLYCGESINVDDLKKKNSLYEIDHILPRTLIKDDSWDNRALVCRKCNQKKGASLVLPKSFRNDYTKSIWNRLKSNELMSNKKFYRLTRSAYSEEDIKGFINRQLVETRQITKHVANILSNFYPKTKIVYFKANISSSYRDKYELYKFRNINDYHHAHDAYLAAVLGNYQEKYLHYDLNYDEISKFNENLKDNEDYRRLHHGIVVNSLDEEFQKDFVEIAPKLINEDTGEIFNAKEFNELIENTLYRNDILISRKTEIKTGEFYNQTKQPKGKKGVSLKQNMPVELYGSYNRVNPSYAVMVRYTCNKNQKQKLVGFPIYLEKSSVETKEHYFRDLLKLEKDDTIQFDNRKIPFYSLINWDNQLCYLVGASNKIEVCNAKEFKYKKVFMKKYKYALNKLFNNKDSEKIGDYSASLDFILDYIINSIENEYKLYSNLVPELKEITNHGDYSIFNIEQKEKLIKELTNLLNIKSDTANLKFLNEKYSSAFGKKNDRIITHCEITNKSLTGLKENRYEL